MHFQIRPQFSAFSALTDSPSSASARAGGADQPWQKPGASRIRHQPYPGEGLHERRGFRCQHDVAGERDTGAGAGGNAVDGRDHRKGQAAQFADQRVVILIKCPAEHDPLARLGHAVVEILTGRESAAGSGQQERAAIGIALRLVEHRFQRAMHVLVESIQPLRPVERHHAIMRALVDEDWRLVHAVFSPFGASWSLLRRRAPVATGRHLTDRPVG